MKKKNKQVKLHVPSANMEAVASHQGAIQGTRELLFYNQQWINT